MARIVADTMDGYMMLGQKLQVGGSGGCFWGAGSGDGGGDGSGFGDGPGGREEGLGVKACRRPAVPAACARLLPSELPGSVVAGVAAAAAGLLRAAEPLR